MNGDDRQKEMRKESSFKTIKKEFLMELLKGFKLKLLQIQWEHYQMNL